MIESQRFTLQNRIPGQPSVSTGNKSPMHLHLLVLVSAVFQEEVSILFHD